MQLVAYGAQDIYLTGNPQITFFKVVYRRHTNFAMETIEQTINGANTTAGGSGTVTISRNGDLVHKIYVSSNTAGIEDGDEIVNEVELEIGGQKIDKHYKEWNQIWAELTIPDSKALAYKNMTASLSHTLGPTVASPALANSAVGMAQIPLNFWFCRNPGLALPLIALQYHEVKLKIKWGTLAAVGATATCKVWCDYIYLDTDERRRFAQVSHEYLIEQLQKQSATASTSTKLNFNHPVKELVWTSAALNAYGTAQLKLNGHDRFAAQEEEYFQLRQPFDHHTAVPGANMSFTDAPVMLTTPIALTSETEVDKVVAGANAAVNAGEISVTAAGVVTFRTATNPGTLYVGDILSLSYPSSAGEQSTHMVQVTTVTTPWAASTTICSVTVSQTGANLAISAAGDGAGYIVARMQGAQSRCSSLSKKINCYSFALKPEEHQPSGTCNFSRIDNAKLDTTGELAAADNIYAVNYNVLRIMSGMGGLAYSN